MSVQVQKNTLRQIVYMHTEPRAWPRQGLSPVNKVICVLVIGSASLAIAETESTLTAGREAWFLGFEWALMLIFAVEYLARVWVSVENPRFGPGWRGRLRFITSPGAIIDLLAVAPILLTLAGSEAFLLRTFRLLRMLRLARLGRFSAAMRHVGVAVHSRRHELMLAVGISMVLLLVASTLLYLVEGDVQPEQFGSIPRAMWWAIMTLTTVGYGDVYPVTAAGRTLAAVTAILGVGMIAMPAGILAASFSEAIRSDKPDSEKRN